MTLTHASAYETFSVFAYAYDALGNRTVTTETVQSPTDDLIFKDDFETGDFSTWTNAVDAGGQLTVTDQNAISGTYMLSATIAGTQQMYVLDQTPSNETHYRARFYFDPNGLAMEDGDNFGMEYGAENGTGTFLKFLFRYTEADGYQVKAGVKDDSDSWQDTSWYALDDDWHHFEFEWRQAAPGESNGYLKLWIDATLQETVSNVDDETREVDKIKLGALTGIDEETSGTFFIEAFESRRHTYIGEIPGGQAPETGDVYRVDEETDDTREFNQTAYLDYQPPVPLPDADFLYFFPAFPTRQGKSRGEELESPAGLQDLQLEAEWGGPIRASGLPSSPTAVITYTYDALNRLTAADYADNTYFYYAYDEVGNRTVLTTTGATVTTYTYDDANRMTKVGATDYAWDANGNLLDDGTNTYGYNHANRMITTTVGTTDYSFAYNGLGDRLQQTVDSTPTDYTLDLVAGLTQVLEDETHTYLYGVRRIGQYEDSWSYYHGDALGSVRQMSAEADYLVLEQAYKPYGGELSSSGSGASSYGFTGEWTDDYINLIHLRSRYYAPGTGRFNSKDAWPGDYFRPLSLNGWNYVEGNPVNRTDPTGHCPGCPWDFKVWASDAGSPEERDIRLREFQQIIWNYGGLGGDTWDILGREADFVEYLQESERLGIDKPGNWYDVSDGYLTASRFAGARLAEYLMGDLGCGNMYLGQLEPGVAEWAAFIMVAEDFQNFARVSQIFADQGISTRFTLSTFLNVGFWGAHNAALREGVRRADAQGLRTVLPDAEQVFTNFMLFNVFEPGDRCTQGNLAFCSFNHPHALTIGSDVFYPQDYPATWDDIERLSILFSPIYGTWTLLGANPPGGAHYIVSVPRPEQWCQENPFTLICHLGWQ